jgi:hypothetical protein
LPFLQVLQNNRQEYHKASCLEILLNNGDK